MAHSGERAMETGRFFCERCRKSVHVDEGQELPVCPHCGNTSFGARSREPDGHRNSR
jgi:predicted RNA-binding Zn-ribbon protein involved in translation (DUF1610 family)